MQELDETRNWILEIQGDPANPTRALAATRSPSGSLILKCDERGENGVYIHVLISEVLDDYADRVADYAFDEEAFTSANWTYLDNNIAQFSPSEVDKFCKRLRGSSTLRMMVYARDGSPRQLNFSTLGANEAIKHVFGKCGDVAPSLNNFEREALRLRAAKLTRGG